MTKLTNKKSNSVKANELRKCEVFEKSFVAMVCATECNARRDALAGVSNIAELKAKNVATLAELVNVISLRASRPVDKLLADTLNEVLSTRDHGKDDAMQTLKTAPVDWPEAMFEGHEYLWNSVNVALEYAKRFNELLARPMPLSAKLSCAKLPRLCDTTFMQFAAMYMKYTGNEVDENGYTSKFHRDSKNFKRSIHATLGEGLCLPTTESAYIEPLGMDSETYEFALTVTQSVKRDSARMVSACVSYCVAMLIQDIVPFTDEDMERRIDRAIMCGATTEKELIAAQIKLKLEEAMQRAAKLAAKASATPRATKSSTKQQTITSTLDALAELGF